MSSKLKPRGKPFQPGDPRAGRKRGALNRATREIREVARGLLERPEYVAKLKERLDAGTAGAVEPLLYHYGYGKPKETVAVEGPVPPFILKVEPD